MFTNKQKVTALTLCHIFETGKPLGNASEVAVLKDGAGISYGIPQATDKSGNLDDVLERYIGKRQSNGNEALYAPFFKTLLPKLRKKTQALINARAKDTELKRILKEAGETASMREAQEESIDSRMRSAIRKAEGSSFETTMALAVIYDSLNHGSYDLIRDRNSTRREDFKTNVSFERAWIQEYVRDRDKWLETHSRIILRSTDYRTDFFLAEIKANNWNLNAPMNVHGFKLSISAINKAVDSMVEAKDVTTIEIEKSVSTVVDNEFTEGERPKADSMNEQPKEPTNTVIDGITKSTEENKTLQVVNAETTNEQTGETTTVKTETEFERPQETEYLTREKPSFTSVVYAAIAFLGSIWALFKATVLEPINEIATINLIVIGVLAVGLAYIGYLIWDKASDRAQERNLKKADYAANLKTNTVEFVNKIQKEVK